MTREQYFSKMNDAKETVLRYDNLLKVSDFNSFEKNNVTENYLMKIIKYIRMDYFNNKIVLKFIDRNNQTINVITDTYYHSYDYGTEISLKKLSSYRTNDMVIRKVIGRIDTEEIDLAISSENDITKLFDIIYSAHMYTVRYNNIAQQQAILNYTENELKRINKYIKLFEEN